MGPDEVRLGPRNRQKGLFIMWKKIITDIRLRMAIAALIDKIIFGAAVLFLVLDLATLNLIGAAIDVALMAYVYWNVGAKDV